MRAGLKQAEWWATEQLGGRPLNRSQGTHRSAEEAAASRYYLRHYALTLFSIRPARRDELFAEILSGLGEVQGAGCLQRYHHERSYQRLNLSESCVTLCETSMQAATTFEHADTAYCSGLHPSHAQGELKTCAHHCADTS